MHDSANPQATGQSDSPTVRLSRTLRRSITVKLMTLALVLGVLAIGAAMIRGTLIERLYRSQEAETEIRSSWGNRQIIAGPALQLETTAPCPARQEKAANGTTVTIRSDEPCVYRRSLLPRSLEWTAGLEPEVRQRGIFRTLLYKGKLEATGEFVVPAGLFEEDELAIRLAAEQGGAAALQWFARSLLVGVQDLQGLVDIEIDVAGKGLSIGGTPQHGGFDHVVGNGLEVLLEREMRLPFRLRLALRGAEALHFVPSAAESTLEIVSSWNAPKFSGPYLPTTREVSDGFRAVWTTTALRRFGPELSVDRSRGSGLFEGTEALALGVDLIFEAGPHQQVERSIKYAILLIGMLLGTVFLLEMLSRVLLHPIQYLLMGCAKLLFFLLLLALSEHIGFAVAFSVAATACTAIIVGYCHSQLRSLGATAALAAALAGLFGFLFVTLSAETYALLLGALGLFAMLSLVMFVTRRLDWYSLRSSSLQGSSMPEGSA